MQINPVKGFPPKPQAAAPQARPAAPSVYRPQTPVEAKLSAPPVYRPVPSAASVQRMPAPPVYRPSPASTSIQQRPTISTPPVYRPFSSLAQPMLRTKRKTTEKKTEETNTRALAGSSAPSKRARRASTTYQNVDLFELHGVAPHQELRTAISNKKIWDGDRKSVSWSTGFAAQFWIDADPHHMGWQCAHSYEDCRQPNYANAHHDLEIGHKTGFYNQIVKNCDPVDVCDGDRHWTVYLYDAVVAANEEESNLEPQCRMCNRDPRQQIKDDRGGGKYKPEDTGACNGDCGLTRIKDL